jgi:hypothetical protein
LLNYSQDVNEYRTNKTKGIQFNRPLIWKQENEYQELLQLAIGFASVSIIRTVPLQWAACYFCQTEKVVETLDALLTIRQ